MGHFPRPELARALADALEGLDPASDTRNGLFLAAPRRTGKTEFLLQDLGPELERRGMLVVYTDLWENKSSPPMPLIAAALARAVRDNRGIVARTAAAVGLEKIGVPGTLSIDLSKAGRTDGLTLYQALDVLHRATEKAIALIVDEAQHALTHDEGDTAMSALKSARDQMKRDGKANLFIVMTGSHRDKLMRLLDSPATPFWGSHVRALPLLGADYVAEFLRLLRAKRPEFAAIRQSAMEEAFEHFGHRPEFLEGAISAAAQTAKDGAALEAALLQVARRQRAAERDALTEIFCGLEPVQRAVLQRLLEKGEHYRAFDAQAMRYYTKTTGAEVTATQVQRALEALRDHDPPLVWKSLRGEYSVYDQALVGWQAYLVGERRWPPRG